MPFIPRLESLGFSGIAHKGFFKEGKMKMSPFYVESDKNGNEGSGDECGKFHSKAFMKTMVRFIS